MPTVDEHASHIEHLLHALEHESRTETVALADALGRVAAMTVHSPLSLPLFRNSQMDGFAVRAADVTTVPVTLPVVADIAAGATTPERLEPQTASRIMTGAIVPEGADCVIPVENTAVEGSMVIGSLVTVQVGRAAGEFVREVGSDIQAGAVLVDAATRLAPRHLAALAAVGISEVEVKPRPRVAVITTGAELVRGNDRGEGQIFDSNLVALTAAATEAGADVVLAESSSDEPDDFAAILDRAITAADLVITSGGVSKGAFEVVRDVLEPLGAKVTSVAMQPGGPQATTVVNGVPVISFPGNPVSSQVSFAVFLAPVLRRIAGFEPEPEWHAILSSSITSTDGKRQFLRGRTLPGGYVELVGGAGSHLVATMATANVLIDVPETATALYGGHDVRVWSL